MVKRSICKLREDEDSIAYRAVCDCTCDDHNQNIWIEIVIEKDWPTLIANFYYNVPVKACWQSYWKRVKAAVKILLGGRVEYEGDFIFSEESLRDYIDTLEEGYTKLQNELQTMRKGRSSN